MEKWRLHAATFIGGATSGVLALEVLPGLVFWPMAGLALAGGVVALRKTRRP